MFGKCIIVQSFTYKNAIDINFEFVFSNSGDTFEKLKWHACLVPISQKVGVIVYVYQIIAQERFNPEHSRSFDIFHLLQALSHQSFQI
jgi:hypothetical protein